LRPIPGILPAVRLAMAAGATRFWVAQQNAAEARLVPGATVDCAEHLGQVLEHFGAPAEHLLVRARHQPSQAVTVPAAPMVADLAEVNGQQEARVALELAAVGGHHLLMTGPAGVGKTLLARCLPGILPPLDDAAAL